MKAIVTGANGFVGRHLVRELATAGYEIIAVVREGCRHLEELQAYENLRVVYNELGRASTLHEKIDEDCTGAYFFDLAWDGHFGDGRKDYARQLKNAKNTIELAESAAKLGCRAFVVSGSVTQLMYRDYLRENDITPDPVSCYPIARMSAEAMLKVICPQIGIDLRWAYISNFYGEDDETTNIINFVIDAYLSGEEPTLTAGEQYADFMHVDDVARALRLFAEMEDFSGSAYIGYGQPRQLKEYFGIIYDHIAPACGNGLGKKIFAGRSVDYDVIDCRWIHEHADFEPQVTFEEAIDRVIEARKRKTDV